MTEGDRAPNNLSRDLEPKYLGIRYRIKNPREIEEFLSRSAKLHLRFALAVVARVMGDQDEIGAMQLKELLEPLTVANDICTEFLSAHRLRFGSVADELDSKFRLGPRPTVELVDQGCLYEMVLQDAMAWNWRFDNEGPWIFWMLRLKPEEAATLGNRKSQIIFVRQPEGLYLLNEGFSLPTAHSLGKTSRESILKTDRAIPIKTQATAQMKACYERLLELIRSERIDLKKTQTIASFLAPVRTMKIRALTPSNGDVERLYVLYYSLALYVDQVRMILRDPTFQESKMSEHLVRFRELAHSCHDQSLKSWCRKFLEYQERFLRCDSSVWPSSTEVLQIDFLNLKDMMVVLNHLRMQMKGTSPARHILATAEIMEIIRMNNPDMSFGEAIRRYGSMIDIWHALETAKPETLRELAEKTELTERTVWEHISTLRKWGAIPSDVYTRFVRSRRQNRRRVESSF